MKNKNYPLLAGISRRNVTPPKGIYLIGYGDRHWGNRGIHDELSATALAFQFQECRVVIIACDLLAINEYTLATVKTGVNENLLACCSHTHSGPIVYADDQSSSKNKKYIDFLVSQLIEVSNEALEDLQPAKISWGQGSADIAINRRERKENGTIEIGLNPDGVIDKSIGIIQVKSIDNDLIGNLVNFSCHNVVFGPKNYFVSADWAGHMRSLVEIETKAPCMFIQGATADLNPNYEWGSDDFNAVDEFGERVAAGVFSAMEDLSEIKVETFKFLESQIWLPLESEAKSDKPPENYKKQLQKILPIPLFLVDTLLNLRYPWKTIIEARGGFWSIPMAVGVLQIGELIWVSLGAEVFNEIGMDVKSKTGSPYSFFSSVSNGCIGYLPTPEEHALGGYEVDLSPFFYRLPGRLQSDSAKITLDEIDKLIQMVLS